MESTNVTSDAWPRGSRRAASSGRCTRRRRACRGRRWAQLIDARRSRDGASSTTRRRRAAAAIRGCSTAVPGRGRRRGRTSSSADFARCNADRGTAGNSLYVVDNYLEDLVIPTVEEAALINYNPFLIDRLLHCQAADGDAAQLRDGQLLRGGRHLRRRRYPQWLCAVARRRHRRLPASARSGRKRLKNGHRAHSVSYCATSMESTFDDLRLIEPLTRAVRDEGYTHRRRSSRGDPARSRRARPARLRADRHRQDGGVRAAHPAAPARARPPPARRHAPIARARAHADARARLADRRELRHLRHVTSATATP